LIRETGEQVGRLETLLDPDEKQQRLGALLARVGVRMSSWARTLQLEHAEDGEVRLDLSKMTIVVDKGVRSIELAQIGSGQNWLGYHLIVHLALHEHFVHNGRPTPRFLFLDQPTQVYFPQDNAEQLRTAEAIKESGNLAPLPDEDRSAVQRVFDFLFDTVEAMEGQFQVIVSDHADLQDARFQEAIVETWRGTHALIPIDWLVTET
jgi:Protein of unknown function (DUF3732)